MLDMVGDKRLLVNEYTSKLFENNPKNLIVCENPLKTAGDEDFCFIENLDICDADINKVIIYRWNRHYPSDKKLSDNLLKNKKIVSSTEFAGNSHEKITQEVYE